MTYNHMTITIYMMLIVITKVVLIIITKFPYLCSCYVHIRHCVSVECKLLRQDNLYIGIVYIVWSF